MNKLPIRDIDIITKEKEQYFNEEKKEAIPIANYDDLTKIGKDEKHPLNGIYVQIDDIDAGVIQKLNSKYDNNQNSYYAGHEPIGTKNNPFNGKYYGGYAGNLAKIITFKISNLNINNRTKGEDIGFFGAVKNAKIENVTLVAINVNGASKAAVGGLVGRSWDSKIINSNSTGKVSCGETKTLDILNKDNNVSSKIIKIIGGASSMVGGLIGWSKNTDIVNNYSESDVIGGKKSYVGGLVGCAIDSHVSFSFYRNGIIRSGKRGYIGGLIGYTDGSHIKSSFVADYTTGIYKGSYIGGLVGYASSSTVADSHSRNVMGSIIKSDVYPIIGGLIGSFIYGKVISLEKKAIVGGLIGMVNNSTIDNSNYVGDVIGSEKSVAGGLVVRITESTVTKSYVKGGKVIVGGIEKVENVLAGFSANSKIND